MGDDVPYFGDHVELSDNHDDFASTLGIGGVVGTQFVLPALVEKHGRFDLTPDREKIFQKWLELYQEKGLSRGQYLGTLYDIGFDLPEAHVIRKEKKMYYAFFATNWNGDVELRGLDDRAYHVVDYVDGKDFGVVQRPGRPFVRRVFETSLTGSNSAKGLGAFLNYLGPFQGYPNLHEDFLCFRPWRSGQIEIS